MSTSRHRPRSLGVLLCLAAVMAMQGCQLTIPNGLLAGAQKPGAVKEPPKEKPAEPTEPAERPKDTDKPVATAGKKPVVAPRKKPARPPVATKPGVNRPGGVAVMPAVIADCKADFLRLDGDGNGLIEMTEFTMWEYVPTIACPDAPMEQPGAEPGGPDPRPMPVERAVLQADEAEPGVIAGDPGGLVSDNGGGLIGAPAPDGCWTTDMVQAEQAYRKYDANGDGFLDPGEFCELHAQWVGGGGIEPAPPPSDGCKDVFVRADGNGDGVVTRDEYIAADYHGGASLPPGVAAPAVMPSEDELYRRFKERDRNGDARLEPWEFCGQPGPNEPPPPPPGGECSYEGIDRSGDRGVDWGEYFEWHYNRVKLSPEEAASYKERMWRSFEQLDQDDDQILWPWEWCPDGASQPPVAPMPEPMPPSDGGCDSQFKTADAGRDGLVEWEEYYRFKRGQIQFFKAPTPEEELRMKEGFYAEFKRADRSADGHLDMKEWSLICGG